jgi:hypothetical protein
MAELPQAGGTIGVDWNTMTITEEETEATPQVTPEEFYANLIPHPIPVVETTVREELTEKEQGVLSEFDNYHIYFSLREWMSREEAERVILSIIGAFIYQKCHTRLVGNHNIKNKTDFWNAVHAFMLENEEEENNVRDIHVNAENKAEIIGSDGDVICTIDLPFVIYL